MITECVENTSERRSWAHVGSHFSVSVRTEHKYLTFLSAPHTKYMYFLQEPEKRRRERKILVSAKNEWCAHKHFISSENCTKGYPHRLNGYYLHERPPFSCACVNQTLIKILTIHMIHKNSINK